MGPIDSCLVVIVMDPKVVHTTLIKRTECDYRPCWVFFTLSSNK